jgi:hypothetical protein
MKALRFTARVDVAEFRRQLVRDKERLREGVMRGFERTAEQAKTLLRGEVRAAGLGQKLGNAVRVDMHPTRARSLRPAIYIYTASALLDYFHEGGVIRGQNGNWLAIPIGEAETKYASTTRSRKGNTVPGNQQRRVARLDLAGRDYELRTRLLKNGNLLLIGLPKRTTIVPRGRPRKGLPPQAAAGVRGVPLFILVREARVPVLLNLERHHQRIADVLVDNINRAMPALVTV